MVLDDADEAKGCEDDVLEEEGSQRKAEKEDKTLLAVDPARRPSVIRPVVVENVRVDLSENKKFHFFSFEVSKERERKSLDTWSRT